MPRLVDLMRSILAPVVQVFTMVKVSSSMDFLKGAALRHTI